MDGFLGTLLIVNLSTAAISSAPLNEAYARQFVGGAGLACRYLYDQINRGTDPLGDENPLMFMTGPLVGTVAPMCGRYEVCARSPQTGLWGEANSGGLFGPYLRFSGYDGILFTGRASHPVYLSIWNGQAELRDATGIWGKDSYETQEAVRNELGRDKLSIACIGRAGENLVKYAAVMNDWGRAAGRTGMGAVMGSKRIMALAVGATGGGRLADGPQLVPAATATTRAVKEDVKAQFFSAGGTASGIDTTMWLGDIPGRYFTKGLWEPTANLSGGTMAETILVGKKGCYRCPVACGRVTSISGIHATERIDGPEYETVVSFGSLILSDDLTGAAFASHLCNVHGLDTISTGATIAFAYYLYDRGVISRADTGGLELEWGDIETALRLVELIALREGFGTVLAEGSRFVGRKYGAEDLAVQVNGLEVPMHDPRAFVGMGLVYATSPRGACHEQGDMFLVDLGAPVPELGIEIGDRLVSSEEKALMTARVMSWRTLYDSLVMCKFCDPGVDLILHPE